MDSVMERLLPEAEQVPLRLRALYERYGYAKFKMSKFETYDLYAGNRQFLDSDRMITFTDASGRLMALKPDITISIAKNAGDTESAEKYYYNEAVYRAGKSGEDFREINQMGLEYIGAGAGYAETEVVSLAADTLSIVGDGEYKLDVSHMGFISGLLESMDITGEERGEVLRALRQKNTGEMEDAAKRSGLSDSDAEKLLLMTRMRSPSGGVLPELAPLVCSEDMAMAARELEILFSALKAAGREKETFLDFSLVNDLDYYNGIVFRGYVRQSPRAVLAGGRYDNLMRRFGKDTPALGFALYLSELDRAFFSPREFDADVLLVYGDADPAAVSREVLKIAEGGESVSAHSSAPEGFKARRTALLDAGEVSSC